MECGGNGNQSVDGPTMLTSEWGGGGCDESVPELGGDQRKSPLPWTDLIKVILVE